MKGTSGPRRNLIRNTVQEIHRPLDRLVWGHHTATTDDHGHPQSHWNRAHQARDHEAQLQYQAAVIHSANKGDSLKDD